MEKRQDLSIQGNYLFQFNDPDPIYAFEKITNLKVNRKESHTIALSRLEKIVPDSKIKKSWWDQFWDDGWSHITFGTVATGFGVGALFIASGPIGWTCAALAIGGGVIGAGAGIGQLITNDPEEKKLFAKWGDAGLAFDNIPGAIAGTGTYIITENFETSVSYGNYAGILGSLGSLARNSAKAFSQQKIYNLKVGEFSTSWSSRTRKINAAIAEIDPKGLEGSHLVPQRVIKELVRKFPHLKRDIENLGNGPLGIQFMPAMTHALFDPYRFQTLRAAQKEELLLKYPLRGAIIQNYPRIAEVLGIFPNMSKTTQPIFTSTVVTAGRAIKSSATETSSSSR